VNINRRFIETLRCHTDCGHDQYMKTGTFASRQSVPA
jgi:hypothetical protein